MLWEGKTRAICTQDRASVRFPGAGRLIFLNASCSKEHPWLRPEVRVPHIFVAVTHHVQLLQLLQSHRCDSLYTHWAHPVPHAP